MKRIEFKQIVINTQNLHKRILAYCSVLTVALLIIACSGEEIGAEEAGSDIEITIDDDTFSADDWTEETHSKNADPNFTEVFDNTLQ